MKKREKIDECTAKARSSSLELRRESSSVGGVAMLQALFEVYVHSNLHRAGEQPPLKIIHDRSRDSLLVIVLSPSSFCVWPPLIFSSFCLASWILSWVTLSWNYKEKQTEIDSWEKLGKKNEKPGHRDLMASLCMEKYNEDIWLSTRLAFRRGDREMREFLDWFFHSRRIIHGKEKDTRVTRLTGRRENDDVDSLKKRQEEEESCGLLSLVFWRRGKSFNALPHGLFFCFSLIQNSFRLSLLKSF